MLKNFNPQNIPAIRYLHVHCTICIYLYNTIMNLSKYQLANADELYHIAGIFQERGQISHKIF